MMTPSFPYSMIVTVTASTLADSGTRAVFRVRPEIGSADTVYTAAVANNVASVKVTPTAANAATVKVNGNAVAPDRFRFHPPGRGQHGHFRERTAQDGKTKRTYKVTVTRAPSANARLSGLGVTTGAGLSPAFNADTLNYTVSYTSAATSLDYPDRRGCRRNPYRRRSAGRSRASRAAPCSLTGVEAHHRRESPGWRNHADL